MPSFEVFKGCEDGYPKKCSTQWSGKLEGDHVLLKITASGLCGTDLHYRNQKMGLGHEGVGRIEALGPACTFLKEGDRVGWGYEHNSCGHCCECLRGRENYCPERAMYGFADLDQGSFASHAVWREAFLFKIPDELSDEDAAPLQCGGATVFNALKAYDTQPTETIGVMGFGGLGHLATQFASKMGCWVVVLSHSDRKKDWALKLGANEFVAMGQTQKLKVSRPLNRLLVTASAQPDWEKIIPVLASGASIHPLSVADGDFQIPYMPLLLNGLTVQGSVVASRHIQREMLQFAAQHGIKPVVETFPMTEAGLREAMDKLDAGKVNFRAVLKPD